MHRFRQIAAAAVAAAYMVSGSVPASAGWIVSETGGAYKPLPSDIIHINKAHTKMTFQAFAHGGKFLETYDVYWDDDCGTWRDDTTKREVFVFPKASITNAVEDVYHTRVSVGSTSYRVRWEKCGEGEQRAPAMTLKLPTFGLTGGDDDDDDGPGFHISIGGN